MPETRKSAKGTVRIDAPWYRLRMELVTGATGFIGRRLVRRLLAEGYKVRALVLPNEATDGLYGAEIVRGDVRDPGSLENASNGVSRVYHLAAVVGDWGDDALFHAVNVEGTRNVLDAAAKARCERVLLVSSIVVYGWQLRSGNCHEDVRRQHGVGPYSRTKRESEELGLHYHRAGHVPVTVVRPGNVYGPGSPLWVDQIVSLLASGSMLLVNGGRGDAVLAYVDNVVDVIVRAARAESALGKVYNANDGGGVSWRQYFSDLAQLTGARPPRWSIPVPAARALAAVMERGAKALRRRERPLFTTEAVILISSRHPVPIRRAIDELDYRPIPYRDAMKEVAAYLQGGTP